MAQNFLNNFIQGLPILREYGNALISPFTGGGLNSQPLGGSGLFGFNEDGTPRSMGGALDFITRQSLERQRRLEEARRRMRGF